MTNLYQEFKERKQKEIDDLPLGFAFSNEQFNEMMTEKFGLTPQDTDKIYSIGMGGYIKREDAENMHNTFKKYDKEQKELMKNEQFVYDMFYYELGNHEFCITYEYEETLDACGLTEDEVWNSEMYKEQLLKAKNDYLKNYNKWLDKQREE